jgi:hypothetical protein
MLEKIQKKVTKTASTLSYKLEQAKYARQLPTLSTVHRQIVEEINREGVAVRSLDELLVDSTPSLHGAFQHLMQDLKDAALLKPEETDYKTGFSHCVPANPTRIARAYPDLYMWGLDDRILDLIENCIGLPVAYHGVIARKEINDGQQVGSRRWHQDQEDRNIIRISIYLNDVGIEDGPFEYVPKPLTPSPRLFNGMVTDEQMAKAVPPEQWKACTGAAGTVVLAATAKVFHHGKVPTSNRERIAVSYYYTSRQPTGADLCRTYSFRAGIPLLNQPLTQRQREALWEYQDLLPKVPVGQEREVQSQPEPAIQVASTVPSITSP